IERSGPTAMPVGMQLAVGTRNSVITPSCVIRPTLFPEHPVHQRYPSGPLTMSVGRLWVGPEIGNSRIRPMVVILPIRPAPDSVNQRLPSAPSAMLQGTENELGNANSVIAPLVETRAIRLPTASVTHRLPSGPATMSSGRLLLLKEYSVIPPPGVITPTL